MTTTQTSEVEQLWVAARDRAEDWRNLRRPAAAMRRVIRALAEHGPAHEGEIARLARVSQPNLTRSYLPKLRLYGFVDPPLLVHPNEVKPEGQGGGRPARVWALTPAGQWLAEALRAETT